jgi:transposase
LAVWSWLRERTALVEWLEEDIGQVGKDAVYEMADKLLQHKSELEVNLRSREDALFGQTAKLFLYDLTNLYMEGSAAGNTLAKRGHSKEKRTDCPLITLALLVDEFGFPLMSEIYAGNQSEPETLEEIVKRLAQQHRTLLDQGTMTFVMDRGIATRENVTLLQDKGYPYIVVERRPVRKAYEREFAQARETFERIDHRERKEEAVYARKVMVAADVAHVLCLSEGKAQKEQAIDRLKEGRLLEDVERLQTSVRKGNIVLVQKVEQRVGRLKEKYPSIARYYDVEVVADEAGRRATDVALTKRSSREERSTLTGCYVIEAYGAHAALGSAEIWQLYMTLHRVEDAFRALKTDLGIRPVYHQTAERTQAHLFISVLAYHLLAVVERQLREHEDTRRWQTVCKELGTHQRSTVVVTDDQDRVHHIRVSGKPEAVHRDIYKKLSITDPLQRSHRTVERRL